MRLCRYTNHYNIGAFMEKGLHAGAGAYFLLQNVASDAMFAVTALWELCVAPRFDEHFAIKVSISKVPSIIHLMPGLWVCGRPDPRAALLEASPGAHRERQAARALFTPAMFGFLCPMCLLCVGPRA